MKNLFIFCTVLALFSCNDKQAKEQGLIGYWQFDSIENGSVKDMSGNGLDGKVVNFSLIEGKFGKAMDSKGEAYLEIPWNAILDSLEGGLTVSTWINRDTSTLWNCIISREIGIGWSEYYDLAINNDTALFSIDPGGLGNFTKILNQEPMPVNEWFHLTGVYDNKTMKFYINGKLVSECNFNLPVKAEDKNPLIIGANSNDAGKTYHDYFYGKIDEVKLYNRPLLASEVEALYISK